MPDAHRSAPLNPGVADPAVVPSALSEAWRAVLSGAQAEPDENFFDCGGDSIAALRLVARLRENGFALRLQDIYEYPELSALAGVMRTAEEATGEPGSVVRLPLLPIQARTLSYDRVDPHHHNDDAVLAVPRGVTAEQLRQALSALADRHVVLGTRFCLDPGEQWQEIGHRTPVEQWARTVEVDPQDAALVTELGREAHRQLDLSVGRLLAARILTHDGAPWGLMLIVHHMVCDGISWEILVADLAREVEAVRTGSTPPAATGTGYATWVRFVSEYAAGPAMEAHVAHWRSRPWEAAATLGLGTGTAARKLSDITTHRVTVGFDDERAFQRASAAMGGEAVVLGTLNHALRKLRGTSTTLIDVVVNGRHQFGQAPDVSRTVGWLADIAPVVTDIGADGDGAEAVRRTFRALRAVPEPRIGFGCVARLHPDPGVRAEFQALPAAEIYLNYRGVRHDYSAGPLPELPYRLGPAQCPDERQPYPLKIVCDLVDGALVTQWRFDPSEIPVADVEELADAFSLSLTEFCRKAGTR